MPPEPHPKVHRLWALWEAVSGIPQTNASQPKSTPKTGPATSGSLGGKSLESRAKPVPCHVGRSGDEFVNPSALNQNTQGFKTPRLRPSQAGLGRRG